MCFAEPQVPGDGGFSFLPGQCLGHPWDLRVRHAAPNLKTGCVRKGCCSYFRPKEPFAKGAAADQTSGEQGEKLGRRHGEETLARQSAGAAPCPI